LFVTVEEQADRNLVQYSDKINEQYW